MSIDPVVLAGTAMVILDFFVILVVFYKRPFDTFLTESPLVGKGLNPLLQDPYMATHPPRSRIVSAVLNASSSRWPRRTGNTPPW